MINLNIRPSASARWLNCSGNPRVQTIADKLPQEPDAPYAAEGTLAHAYLEFCLTGENDTELFDALPEDDKKLISDVADQITWYAETCGYEIETEREYKITLTLQDGRTVDIVGHIDVLLSNDDSLVVLDYKHGAGKHVSVVNNPQTLLYLLAAVEGRAAEGKPPSLNHAMGIIQPRGVGDGWRMINVPADKLTEFRAEVVTAVEAAYKPWVEYNRGPHCWKCPGQRGLCPAVLSQAVDVIVQTPPKDTFKDEEVEAIFGRIFGGSLPWPLLDKLDDVKAFVKELSAYADVYLKSGKPIPGWALETAPGRRTWAEPEEVPAVLAELLGGTPAMYEKVVKSPITLTEAERRAKKKGVKIDGLIKKPVTQKRVKSEAANPLGFSAVE